MIGIRGKKKLMVDGCTFYRFLSTKTNQTWYCSQRKSQKCRASFRLFPNGQLLPVITEHTHKTPSNFNTVVHTTTNPNDLYFDSDNHVQIDMVAFVKPDINSETDKWISYTMFKYIFFLIFRRIDLSFCYCFFHIKMCSQLCFSKGKTTTTPKISNKKCFLLAMPE